MGGYSRNRLLQTSKSTTCVHTRAASPTATADCGCGAVDGRTGLRTRSARRVRGCFQPAPRPALRQARGTVRRLRHNISGPVGERPAADVWCSSADLIASVRLARAFVVERTTRIELAFSAWEDHRGTLADRVWAGCAVRPRYTPVSSLSWGLLTGPGLNDAVQGEFRTLTHLPSPRLSNASRPDQSGRYPVALTPSGGHLAREDVHHGKTTSGVYP